MNAAGASTALQLRRRAVQVVARALASTGGERSKFPVVSQKDEPLSRVVEADLIYSRITIRSESIFVGGITVNRHDF